MVSPQPLSPIQLRYHYQPCVDPPRIGQALWERNAEGNICVQTVYWKWRRTGSITGQRGKPKSNTVTTKDFINPMGSSGAGMALVSYPILKQEARPLYSYIDQSLDIGCSLLLEAIQKGLGWELSTAMPPTLPLPS